MSTHAIINVKVGDGYKSAYLHSDGYPEYALRMLQEHYNDEQKALALVSLGDMSLLAERLEPESGSEHSFSNRQEGVCMFYKRDRGELNCECVTSSQPNTDERWNYLFADGEWITISSNYEGE